jgi:hypothetical protein
MPTRHAPPLVHVLKLRERGSTEWSAMFAVAFHAICWSNPRVAVYLAPRRAAHLAASGRAQDGKFQRPRREPSCARISAISAPTRSLKCDETANSPGPDRE